MLEQHCMTSHVVRNAGENAGNATFKTAWDNSSRSWSPHDYSAKREKAKATLETVNQKMSDQMLVQECLKGISDDILVPTGVKSNIRVAGGPHENDCHAAVGCMQSAWQASAASKSYNRKRVTSSTTGNQRGSNGNGGHRNGGRNDGGKRHKSNQSFKPENRTCPKQEWFAPSKDQRDAVIKLRKETKSKKQEAKATAEAKRLAATVTTPPGEEPAENKWVQFQEDLTNAGNRFGRSSHQ